MTMPPEPAMDPEAHVIEDKDFEEALREAEEEESSSEDEDDLYAP